jgi:hypothetical protein
MRLPSCKDTAAEWAWRGDSASMLGLVAMQMLLAQVARCATRVMTCKSLVGVGHLDCPVWLYSCDMEYRSVLV